MITYHWIEERSVIGGDPSVWYLRDEKGKWYATVRWIKGRWSCNTDDWAGWDRSMFATLEEAKAAALIDARFK